MNLLGPRLDCIPAFPINPQSVVMPNPGIVHELDPHLPQNPRPFVQPVSPLVRAAEMYVKRVSLTSKKNWWLGAY